MLDNGTIDIEGHRLVSLSISSTASQTAALNDSQEGIYDIISDVDCSVKVAPTANDVTTATGYPLIAGNTVPFFVRKGRRIGAITASGSGTLRIHRKQ